MLLAIATCLCDDYSSPTVSAAISATHCASIHGWMAWMAHEETSTPSSITMLAILLDGRVPGHYVMRKHHSKSAQVSGAACGAWGGHTYTHLSSCPTSDTAMLWDLDFSGSLHTCSKRFWCHPASTVESRPRGYSPTILDHPGCPGRPRERSVRVCFSVPGMPVNSWDKSHILGQVPVTALSSVSRALILRRQAALASCSPRLCQIRGAEVVRLTGGECCMSSSRISARLTEVRAAVMNIGRSTSELSKLEQACLN